MSRLHDHLKGVNQDSPPAEPEEEELEPEEPEAGEEEGEPKEGRTSENVRGELLRKLEKQERRFESRMQNLQSSIEKLIVQVRETPAPKGGTDADSLDDLSIEQLEALRGQVPEEKREAFNEYLYSRKLDDKFDSFTKSFQKKETDKQQRTRYTQKAMVLYPELKQADSDFAVEVDRRLGEYPDELFKVNPRALLDIANEVAVEMQVAPKSGRRKAPKVARTDTAPAKKGQVASKYTDEQEAEIARKLKSALPKGKEFDMADIKKQREFLSKNLVLYRKGSE